MVANDDNLNQAQTASKPSSSQLECSKIKKIDTDKASACKVECKNITQPENPIQTQKDIRKLILSIIFIALGFTFVGIGFIQSIRSNVFIVTEVLWCGGLILVLAGAWLLFKYYKLVKPKLDNIPETTVTSTNANDKI